MKQIIIHFIFITMAFAIVIACDKTDDPGGDFPSAGTVKDADGNKYNTIKIGTQIWMVENLKTTKYNDGTAIPNVTDDDKWTSLTTGAYCNYDNLESNAEIYGRLYNWYAVNTGILAPTGWHVPTIDDWIVLYEYMIANGYSYDGIKDEDKIAKALCAKKNWEFCDETGTPGNVPEDNNSSGFSALPGGGCNIYGDFREIGESCFWWSSVKDDSDSDNAYIIALYYDNSRLNGDDDNSAGMVCGFSVRLVKD